MNQNNKTWPIRTHFFFLYFTSCKTTERPKTRINTEKSRYKLHKNAIKIKKKQWEHMVSII